MATARTAHPVRLLILVAAIAGLLAGLMGGTAQAANNNTIEQHWELLADTVTGQIGEKRLFIRRGDLPGGTTGFDPAPSATMEAVAKVTGAGNASSGYDIQVLDTSGSLIASVPFRGSDSDFTLEKTASPFAWNSSTRAISELKIVPVGTIPGAIDVKKAYFKLRQSGTIKKTIGRVPLASKSLGITRADFGDLPDLLTYNHVAGDFNPAPTVQLRVTAQATLCTLKVALVNLGTGLPVSGSELSFTSLGSQITGPLTLNHGDTRYKIQAKAEQTNCGTQSQSGPQQQSGGEPGAAGDVLSADLILSQSTTDTKGLVRTVGWYPSITASTTVAQNSQLQGFQFNSPVMSVPNPISSKWLTMVKLSTGTSVGAHMAYVSNSTNHTTSPLSSTTSWVAVEAPITSLPSAATKFDTKAALAGTGAAGVISGSLIRSALHLWDISPPQLVGSLNQINPAFSPQVSIGSKDTTTCYATLGDYSPVTWTIDVRAGATGTGELQRTGTGSGLSPSYTWDGTKATGNSPDGQYACILSAFDDSGNAIPAPLPAQTITIDRAAPTITGFQSSVPRISPTNGPPTSTTFTASISEPVTWTISIAPSSGGSPVRTFTGTTTNISQVWDGRTLGGVPVADNDYTATLTALDAAGNSTTQTAAITVDKTGPTITGFAASNPDFSPGVSIGSKDTTTLTATLSDPWTPNSWLIEIVTGATVHRSFSGSGNSVSVVWDGRDSNGSILPDGVYTAWITARDAGNNSRLNAANIRVDTVFPVIDPRFVMPLDHGNTIFASQSLMAKVYDAASGIQPGSGDFVLTRHSLNPPTSTTYSGAAVTYTSSSGWMRTNPVALTVGHVYSMSLGIEDKAGNRSTYAHGPAGDGGGFTAITAAASPSSARIPATECSLSATDFSTVPPTKVATCTDVPLHLTDGSLSLSSSRHAGVGYVEQRVSLETATITIEAAGTPLPPSSAYSSIDPAWAPRTISTQYVTLDRGSQSQSITLTSVEAVVGTLTTRVAAAAESATLEMAPVAALLDPAYQVAGIPACSDPSAVSFSCSPDAMRFFFGDLAADEFRETATRSLREKANDTVPEEPYDETYINYFSLYDEVTQHWNAIGPLGVCVDATCTPRLDIPDYPAVPPGFYATVCGGMIDCVHPDFNNQIPAGGGGEYTEWQKQNMTMGTVVRDWLPGELSGGETEGSNRDWWHFSGHAGVIIQTTKNLSDAERGTLCDHRLKQFQGPFRCYGYRDSANSLDGLGVAWSGEWHIPGGPNNRHYNLGAEQFAIRSNCFANEAGYTGGGEFEERNSLRWDWNGLLYNSKYPESMSVGGVGLSVRQNNNQSAAMKMRQGGFFYGGIIECAWVNWWMELGGNLYQDRTTSDPGPNSGEAAGVAHHHWKERSWSWNMTCGAGTSGPNCAVAASPTEDDANWTRYSDPRVYHY